MRSLLSTRKEEERSNRKVIAIASYLLTPIVVPISVAHL